MLLQLDQQLFHQPGDEVALSSLLLAVLVQEHTLLLRPGWRKGEAAPPWRAFLPAGQGGQMAALLDARLERSMEEAAGRSSLNGAVVVRAQPQGPRELRPGEAARLAWMPLWLVLENGRNDLRFLRGVLPPPVRSWLDRALERGQIEVPPGGGTGEMGALLQELVSAPNVGSHAEKALSQRLRALRVWALFDRDVDPVDLTRPSSTSENLRVLCTDHGIPHCQLGRRTMESYLPMEVLTRWAEKGSDAQEKKARYGTLAAYRSLTEAQRRAFNWKEGLRKDASEAGRRALKRTQTPLPDDALPALFRGLDPDNRVALTYGFGKKIGEDWGALSSKGEAQVERNFQDPAEAAWRDGLIRSLKEAR